MESCHPEGVWRGCKARSDWLKDLVFGIEAYSHSGNEILSFLERPLPPFSHSGWQDLHRKIKPFISLGALLLEGHFWHNWLDMHKRFAILPIILLLSACRSQSTAAPTHTPIPTLTPTFIAIPKTQTPTPTPEPSHTPTPAPPPFSTLEVERDDLEGQQAGLRAEFGDDIGLLEDATRYWIEVKVDFKTVSSRSYLKTTIFE